MSTKSNTYFQHLMKRDHADLLEDGDSEESDYPGSTPHGIGKIALNQRRLWTRC